MLRLLGLDSRCGLVWHHQPATHHHFCAGGSSLAAYADFTAAQAAAAAEGHPYAGGFRTAWAPGGTQAKFSNGLVAAVLFVPLVIT